MEFIDLGNGAECVIYDDGTKHWYLNETVHRIDGPAVENADGSKEWWINNVEYSEEEFDMIKQMLWAV